MADVLSEDERQDVREAFDLFDTSRRGSVDLHAFVVALRAMGFDGVDKAAAAALAERAMESNAAAAATAGDSAAALTATFAGRVDFPTFLEVVRQLTQQRDPVQHLMSAFDLFDVDQTGKISVANVETVATKLGERLSHAEIEAMVDEFDRDQDGYIDRKEFLYIMQQLY